MSLWFPFLLPTALAMMIAIMLVDDHHCRDHEPDDRIDTIRCPECGGNIIHDKEKR